MTPGGDSTSLRFESAVGIVEVEAMRFERVDDTGSWLASAFFDDGYCFLDEAPYPCTGSRFAIVRPRPE